MTHPRNVIRNALVSFLNAANSGNGVGAPVVANRSTPIGVREAPYVLVYINEDQIDARGSSDETVTVPESDTFHGVLLNSFQLVPIIKHHIASVVIEVAVAGLEQVNEADDLSWAVEIALDADPTLGKLVDYIRWQHMALGLSSDTSTGFAVARNRFELSYYTTSIKTGTAPTQIYLGLAPNIGEGHEGDYVRVDTLPNTDMPVFPWNRRE